MNLLSKLEKKFCISIFSGFNGLLILLLRINLPKDTLSEAYSETSQNLR